MKQWFTSPLVAMICLSLFCSTGQASTWLPFGPDGGDARAIAADPHDPKHLYLGAANGWVYETRDAAKTWKRVARVGRRDDLVLDNIIVDATDSKHILVGAWVLGSQDGGLYISQDGGLSWTANSSMAGQSIRALTASDSDPKVIIAGTLKGVYRSTDGGKAWNLISPEGSSELHEVESIAIDPKDPAVIYAGTWHLPWKTTDSGEHWNNIKEGVIEDSDVFSIIVDPKQPSIVYASACSGIYKSVNAGEHFNKIQGIPSTARRTRVLMQDPSHLETVYAGTTEGLFRSDDSGATWVRTTGPELIVNDVYVDPTDSAHVLLATDRGGVLTSHDRGNSFEGANAGFSTRQVTSYVGDARQPSIAYVGVVNDKGWGGVFESDTGGLSWVQTSAGLGGRDVFSLGQASDGTILAGTGHGIYRLKDGMWSRAVSTIAPQTSANSTAKKVTSGASARVTSKRNVRTGRGIAPAKKRARSSPEFAKAVDFDGSVYAIAARGDTIYAATSQGLLSSVTAGESWNEVPGFEKQPLLFVSASRETILTADLKIAKLSVDNGRSWSVLKLPNTLTQISALAVDGTGGLWIGGREGLFASGDQGATWDSPKNLYIRDVNSIFYDAVADRLLITAGGSSTIAFSLHLPERTVKFWDTGWKMRFARPVGDHLIAATLFDGTIVQPQMMDSAESVKP